MTQQLPGRLRPADDERAPRPRLRWAITITAALVVAAVGAGIWFALSSGDNENPEPPLPPTAPTAEPEPAAEPEPSPEPEPTPEPEPEPTWNIDDPESVQVVMNKHRPFDPIDWQPNDLVMPEGIGNTNGQPLRAEAARSVEDMHAAAAADGVSFHIISAFRPYSLQVSLFDAYIARDGLEEALTYSAKPGFSEHQTGLTVDLDDGAGCALSYCFGDTAAGIWLRENAHRFGYILRYHEGQEHVVGYIYEPWHFRYVGTEVAGQMHEAGILNLEDFFGLPPAPDYR